MGNKIDIVVKDHGYRHHTDVGLNSSFPFSSILNLNLQITFSH